jgi:hypothetical protein
MEVTESPFFPELNDSELAPGSGCQWQTVTDGPGGPRPGRQPRRRTAGHWHHTMRAGRCPGGAGEPDRVARLPYGCRRTELERRTEKDRGFGGDVSAGVKSS